MAQMKSREWCIKNAPKPGGRLSLICLLLLVILSDVQVASSENLLNESTGSVRHGTAVVTGHFPHIVAVAADRGGRRRVQGSSREENVEVCKIAAVRNRFLLSYTTMDIQTDVNDPEDHLLQRAAAVINRAPLEEPLERIVWQIAEREANVMANWNKQEPRFFEMQPLGERGPSITVSHMDVEGKSNVFIIELKMIEHADHEFSPIFEVKSVEQGAIAFGARATDVRNELLDRQTGRSHKRRKVLTALLAANTLTRFRQAALDFIDLAKVWYPGDVFGATDFAILTPAGISWLGPEQCR